MNWHCISYGSRHNKCMLYKDGKTICIDPSLPVFQLIGKKYTMFILGVIGNNNSRKNFNDIVKSIPGCSRTIIATRIKELIQAGMIRKCYSKILSDELTEFGCKIRKGIISFLAKLE